MATKSSTPRNVLVVRFSALGDIAIAVPVLYAMCRAHSDVRFIMLTRKWTANVFYDRPSNLVVKGVDVTKDYKGVPGMIRLARELRKTYDIDAVADLHSVSRSWVLGASMRLHGVPVARIDKGRGDKRRLVSGQDKRQLTSTHDRYAAVFAALGLTADDNFEGFTAAKTSVLPAKAPGEKWVAVAPFSQHRGKEYPLTLTERVIEQLLASDERVNIILFGGGNKEKKALAKLAESHPRTVSLAGIDHGFTDEYAVLRQCDAMVSMDSANMHLASLTRTPVVSVWGATHPYCGFMGWKQDPANAVQLDLPCRPCSVFGNKPCRHGDYHCLADIDPATIVARVKAILDKN